MIALWAGLALIFCGAMLRRPDGRTAIVAGALLASTGVMTMNGLEGVVLWLARVVFFSALLVAALSVIKTRIWRTLPFLLYAITYAILCALSAFEGRIGKLEAPLAIAALVAVCAAAVLSIVRIERLRRGVRVK
ncbi:MAG: hypothetical protein WCQ64_15435 [Acidobacteriota bacterium]